MSYNTYEKSTSVEWNGDTFIMTIRSEIGNFYSYASSSDGITWTNVSLPTTMSTKNPYFTKWIGDKHIMGGNLVTGESSILTNVRNGVTRESIEAPAGYQVYDVETNLEYLNTVTFPRSVIMAMGGQAADTNKAFYSNDQGVSWTAISGSPFATTFKDAAWNGKRWVGVGAGGNTMASSHDGSVWTGRGSATFTTSGNAVEWDDIKNMYVAVGSGGNVIASSVDGVYWSGRSSNIFASGNDVRCNGNVWVAAGVPIDGNNKSLAYSYDGINWFTPSQGNLFSTSAVKVAYFESQWVAVGIDPSYNLAFSVDGINWTMVYDASFSGDMKSAYANYYDIYIVATNNYALLPESSLERKILKSDVSCNAIINVKTATLIGGNGQISFSSNFDIYTNIPLSGITSVNSFSWNRPNRGYADIRPLSIACGSGAGSLAYSEDGIQWFNIANSIFTTRANKAAWNGKLWVAVGAGNFWVASSYDGKTWLGRNSALMTECYDVAWNGYTFIAVGTGSNIMAKSTDGITWTAVSSITSVFSSSASAIEWTGSRWLAYGSGGNTTAVSADIYGEVWTATSSQNLAITAATAITPSATSSSSNQTSFPASNAFDGSFNTTMTEWYSGAATYTASTGVYAGSTQTTYNDTLSASGEWLQVQASAAGVAKYYYVTINNNSTTAIPKQWLLLGSTDGSTWTQIHSFTNTAASYPNNTWKYGWTSFPINIYSNTASYTYYRLVFQASYGQTYVAVADLHIFYATGSSTTLNTKLRPIMMKNAVLHPTQILSVDGTFLNIYQLTDLNLNLIDNLYINSSYVKNVVYGLGSGIITSGCFDGYNHIVGANNGNVALVPNANSYTNFNFDGSFNSTSLVSGLTTVHGACFNKQFLLLGGTGGNVITYNALVSGSGAYSSTFQSTNANSIFTQVNGIASNSGYGFVVPPSAIYLSKSDTLSLVAPKSYNQTILPETAISFEQYPV